MAVDVCSEISSPRISFSHDLKELDCVPVELESPILDPTVDFDFDFCVAGNRSPEISPADELFADGRILPVQIKAAAVTVNKPEARNPGPSPACSKPSSGLQKTLESETANKKRLIEFLSGGDDDQEEKSLPKSPPFWQFRRSSSDNSRANGLLRSLQFLTRSNSTGSVPTPKPSPAFPKVIRKQHSLKEISLSHQRNSSPPSVNPHCPYGNNYSSKKPSLRKSSSTSGAGSRPYGTGNGVRISPVLNIPPAYIARGTVSLFGFGSIFCSKKSKKKRK